MARPSRISAQHSCNYSDVPAPRGHRTIKLVTRVGLAFRNSSPVLTDQEDGTEPLAASADKPSVGQTEGSRGPYRYGQGPGIPRGAPVIAEELLERRSRLETALGARVWWMLACCLRMGAL